MTRFALAIIPLAAAALIACGPPRVCVPGSTQACLGPAQCPGVQSCNVAGTGYDACSCGTGGSGGSGGMGGSGGSGGSGGAGGSSGPKPNVMILLDKSGSMAAPVDTANPNCPASSCPGASCPANCPTRISEVRSAMSTFLTQYGGYARYGLTTYPVDATCGAPTGVRIDISTSNDVPSELGAQADTIRSAINAIGITGTQAPGSLNEVGGGTPTGGALNLFSTYAPLTGNTRSDYVLLLTDGLPNCNPSNSNNCLNPTACRCTTTSCGTDTSHPFCTLGCLDQGGAVAAATTLRNLGIKTVVLAFGADATTGDATTVLNAVATAGGTPVLCPNGTNAECGPGNTCDTASRGCTFRYYRASNAAELAAALSSIATNVLK